MESSVLERCGSAGERSPKMIPGMEHLSYEDRMRELFGTGCSARRRLQGDLAAALQCS